MQATTQRVLPAGTYVREVRCDDQGRLEVVVTSGSVGGGGGSGTSDTTEATQLLVKAAVENTNTAVGAKADAAATDSTSSWGVISLLKGLWAQINALRTNVSLATGANVIGAVTQSGSWNIGSISTLPALILSAGSAIIGKVGIDQTTLGTTNGVSLAQVGATTVATGNGVVGAGVQRVAIASDNTPFPISQTKATLSTATVMQNAVSASANGSTLDVAGYSIAVIEVTGTFVATVTFEASNDDTVWHAVSATNIGNTAIASTTTTTGLFRLSVGGFKSIRARVTWTSGTSVTAKGYVTIAEADPKVVNSLLPFTIAGEDIANDVLKVESRYSAANITTQTTTTVKSGAGLLKRIVFNKPLASGVVAVYDNTAGSGTLIATITLPSTLLNGPFFLDYEDVVTTGITVVTSGATQDITVIYR